MVIGVLWGVLGALGGLGVPVLVFRARRRVRAVCLVVTRDFSSSGMACEMNVWLNQSKDRTPSIVYTARS